MNKIVIIILLILCPSLSCAERIPPAHHLDQRIRNVTYMDGQVYCVYISLLRTTTIEFPLGEILEIVVAGDTEALKFERAPGGRTVSFKPVQSGLRTNVTLYTNRRSYYLEVIEHPQKTYFSVRFNGGYTSKESINKHIQFTGIHTLYGANIKNAITPIEIWDNGVYTYFKFYKTSPIPAIFKTRTGEETSINSSIMEEGIVRVSGISNYWILRYGELETVICRYPSSK